MQQQLLSYYFIKKIRKIVGVSDFRDDFDDDDLQ